MNYSAVTPELAKALSTAFSADVFRSPSLSKVLESGLSPMSLRNIILRDIGRDISGDPGPQLFPNMRALIRSQVPVDEYRKAVGLGQDFGAIIQAIAPAIGAVAVGAIGIANAKQQSAAAVSIAKTQQQMQQTQLEEAQIEANTARLNLANAQVAQAQAQGVNTGLVPLPSTSSQPLSLGTLFGGGGSPLSPDTSSVLATVGLVAIGGAAAYLFMRHR